MNKKKDAKSTEKDSNNKTVTELTNELKFNEKIMEKALKIFKGKKVIIRILMYSSVTSSISIYKLDWIHLIGFNEQHYIYISEYPFESIPGNNLVFDIDNIDEVEYIENNLSIHFIDGLHLNINTEKNNNLF